MRRILTIVLLLLLAGCAGPREGAAPPVPSAVTVERGDTVYGIARRFDVPQRDLIEVNGLEPPYLLMPGQVLRMPRPRLYSVRGGDTLYGISRQYDVDVSELARINDLLPPYRIYLGQQLRLPSVGTETVVAEAAAYSPPAPPRTAPRPEIIARAPAAGPAPAPRRTPDPAPARAAPRSAPAPSEPVPSEPVPSEPVATASAGAAAVTAPAPMPARKPDQTPPVRTAAVAAPAPPPASPTRTGTRFAWPLAGEVVSGFGPKGSGVHNDGINIAAERGTPVRAADGGIVAYAGNELRGYGNLVLIRHADGWVTAYGHNDRILVRRGERVTAGQPIATVGSTGAVGTPQLHFEVRRGTEAIDPLKHLPTPRG